MNAPSATTVKFILLVTLPQEVATDHIPGATVAIVRDGALFFAKGYGYADLVQQTLKNNTQSLAAWPGEKRPR